MKEDVLEVQSASARRRRSADLEELAGVKEAALFGKGLHVVVDRADECGPGRCAPPWRRGGFAVGRIEKIVPSLEDVFVSLIEARDRQEAPEAEVRR